jgi:predicted small lipoprotein YifL
MKFLILAVLLGLTLTDCGRKGAPSPPGPASRVTYPQIYPTQ